MSEYIAKPLKQDKEDWMTKKWRPMMAITYMMINIFDFIVGPILFNLLQYWNPGQNITAYTSLTLQGGGLIHIAFGAILGISAYTRGQEKVAAINNGIDPNTPASTSSYSTTTAPATSGFGDPAPAKSGFGSAPATSGFGSTPAADAPLRRPK
jgi:hypothetical protein